MIKKMILLIGLLASTGGLNAQSIISYSNGITLRADQLFDLPRPGYSTIKFDFLLAERNRMTIEFNSICQLDSMPGIDALLEEVWNNIRNFRDSTADPLLSHRFDYQKNSKDIKIRIQTYTQKGEVYQIKEKDIFQVKTLQDTLRIRLFTQSMPNRFREKEISYYYINLYLNDIDILPQLIQTGKIEQAIEVLERDVANNLNLKKSKHFIRRYYGLYDMISMRRVYPEKGNSMINYGVGTFTIPPNIGAGLHYIKGNWAVSVGIGLNIIKHITTYQEQHYSLLWEPYFFFKNNPAGKITSSRNSFLTIGYSHRILSGGSRKEIEYARGFSIGYLVKKTGDWLEPSTFKFSMNAMQGNHWTLAPEFFFHKFLKGIAPSVKVLLYFGIE